MADKEWEYRCSCGCWFPASLGKYGCPNCLGDGRARLARVTRKKLAEQGKKDLTSRKQAP